MGHAGAAGGPRRTAFAVLGLRPSEPVLRMARDVARDAAASPGGIERVFVVVDDPAWAPPAGDGALLTYVRPGDAEVAAAGFNGACQATIPNGRPTAWGKALYAFSRVPELAGYDFVWLLEDDVLVPCPAAARAVDARHGSGGRADLVCQRHQPRVPDEPWHWHHADAYRMPHEPHHRKSMVCAVGVSRRLLRAVGALAAERGSLPFIEFLFNTLAEAGGMEVSCVPDELDVPYCRPAPCDVEAKLASGGPEARLRWYHPVKDPAAYARLYSSDPPRAAATRPA